MSERDYVVIEVSMNYFAVCEALAKSSKCFSRKIGAILVKDKLIVATGYNGPPRGVPHCNERLALIARHMREVGIVGTEYRMDELLFKEIIERKMSASDLGSFAFDYCPRKKLGYESSKGLHLCTAAHSERNCLAAAARLGVSTLGTTLYLNCCIPCKDCLIELINAGVTEIHATDGKLYDEMSPFLIKNSGIKIVAPGWTTAKMFGREVSLPR